MKKSLLYFLLIGIIIHGCTIKTGRFFDYQKTNQLKLGLSKKQITEMFGEPFMQTTRKGHECWIYNYSENEYNGISVSDPKQINVGVVFDKNDRVYSYEYNRNYEPVEKIQVGKYYEK